jgi:adenosylcobinamide-GDP ribazoletransferase
MKILAEQLRLFFVALQFFTRIPIHPKLTAWMDWTPERLRASSRYFSLVGWLVGTIAALAYFAVAPLWGALIAGIGAIATSAWITGAFHEDGFADYFDSFGAGSDRAKALDIMKDSRIGTFGALALVILSALKIAALAQLNLLNAMLALLCAHALGRTSACAVLARLNYVRFDNDAKSKPLAERMNAGELAVALAIGSAPLIAACSIELISLKLALSIALVIAIATLLFARHLQKRLGGFTGDTLGAMEQLTEVLVLLLFAASIPWLR